MSAGQPSSLSPPGPAHTPLATCQNRAAGTGTPRRHGISAKSENLANRNTDIEQEYAPGTGRAAPRSAPPRGDRSPARPRVRTRLLSIMMPSPAPFRTCWAWHVRGRSLPLPLRTTRRFPRRMRMSELAVPPTWSSWTGPVPRPRAVSDWDLYAGSVYANTSPIWVQARVSLLVAAGKPLPPLVTTSPAGTPQAEAGVLGEPNTQVLFGGNRVDDEARSGFRTSLGVRLGHWFDAWMDSELQFDYCGWVTGRPRVTSRRIRRSMRFSRGRSSMRNSGQQDAQLICLSECRCRRHPDRDIERSSRCRRAVSSPDGCAAIADVSNGWPGIAISNCRSNWHAHEAAVGDGPGRHVCRWARRSTSWRT